MLQRINGKPDVEVTQDFKRALGFINKPFVLKSKKELLDVWKLLQQFFTQEFLETFLGVERLAIMKPVFYDGLDNARWAIQNAINGSANLTSEIQYQLDFDLGSHLALEGYARQILDLEERRLEGWDAKLIQNIGSIWRFADRFIPIQTVRIVPNYNIDPKVSFLHPNDMLGWYGKKVGLVGTAHVQFVLAGWRQREEA